MPIACPANYFGKGANYILPDNEEEVRAFEQLFDKWVTDHPDDPTGELALATEKKNNKSDYGWNPGYALEIGSKGIANPVDPRDLPPDKIEINGETTQLTLELPKEFIKKLKRIAIHKKRRPRDIIMSYIKNDPTL